ncbi:MAG: hypothetical protein KAJ01_01095 [Candidatus Hydrogenedentes bacterium]|nr:hypothetical protein [Candidatus Hydrogenedentota bacterium]
MKMRIARTILLLAVVFLLGYPGTAVARKKTRGGLKFSISLDKTEYKKTDQIYVNFTLKNEGKKPVYVNKRFHINTEDSPKEEKEVYLIVTAPSGEKLTCREKPYDTGFPKTDYFVLLKRNEEAVSERKKRLKIYFDIKEPGTYTVAAVYKNVYGKEIGVEAFQGELKSDPVTMKIIEK